MPEIHDCLLIFLLTDNIDDGVDDDTGPVDDVGDGVPVGVVVALVHGLDNHRGHVGQDEEHKDTRQHQHEQLNRQQSRMLIFQRLNLYLFLLPCIHTHSIVIICMDMFQLNYYKIIQ